MQFEFVTAAPKHLKFTTLSKDFSAFILWFCLIFWLWDRNLRYSFLLSSWEPSYLLAASGVYVFIYIIYIATKNYHQYAKVADVFHSPTFPPPLDHDNLF